MSENKFIGRTRIELTDVHTGKPERYDSKNTFLSANLEKKFKDYGIFNTDIRRNFYDMELWRKVCGGILLLDTAVTSTNFVDLGIKQVGRGYYGSSNNGSPVSLGSWNASESVVTDNSIQMVYDFTTSQANGNINSVCLTSDYCGRIGIGNEDGDYNTNYVVDVKNWHTFNQTINTNITNLGNGFGFDGTYIYFNPIVSGTTLTISKKIGNANKVDLISYPQDTRVFATATITLDNAMTHTDNLRLIQFSNTRLALIGYTGQSYSDTSFSVADIDLSTSTATVYEISGMPALSSNYASYNYAYIEAIGIDSNSHLHIAIPTYEYVATAFAVDVTDGSVVTFKDNNRTSSHQTYSFCQHLDNGLFMYSYGTSANYSYVCDYVNETMYPCEGYTTGNRLLGGIDLVGVNADSYIRLTQNPFYLATINNLDSQITKTSSKTMKVTYTLTRS